MLGVSPATLRRWAEAGDIPTFTTPGGHRRFSRTALAARLPATRPPRPDLVGLGETTEGITERYRLHAGGTAAAAPWLGAVPESSRARLRDHGRVIAASLIASIEATGERERLAALADGIEAASDYGRIAGTLGASMRQTVATFLQFRPTLRRGDGSRGAAPPARRRRHRRPARRPSRRRSTASSTRRSRATSRP